MPGVGDMHVNGTQRRKRNRLSKVRVDFISLVDRPDCPSATVEILKRAPESFDQNLSRTHVAGSAREHYTKPGETHMPQGKEPGADLDLDGLPEPVVKYILNLEDELLAHINKGETNVLDVDGDVDGDEGDEGDEGEEFDFSALDELTDDELVEVLTEAGVDFDDLAAADEGELAFEGEDGDVEKLLKSAPPALVAIVKSMSARLDQAEQDARRERTTRRVTELRKWAAEEASSLPMATGDLTSILLKAEDALDSADFTVLCEVLRKASKAVEEAGLFEERGTTGAASSGSKLDELAKRAMRVAEESGRVSPEQALLKMMEMDSSAYDDEERAKMGGRR